MVFGQPAGLSKEVFLYQDVDRLQLIGQSEGGERSADVLGQQSVGALKRVIARQFQRFS